MVQIQYGTSRGLILHKKIDERQQALIDHRVWYPLFILRGHPKPSSTVSRKAQPATRDVVTYTRLDLPALLMPLLDKVNQRVINILRM